MLPEIIKSDHMRSLTFEEFIKLGEATQEERQNLREFNKELTETLHKNPDGSESWFCKSCPQILVKDINGSRAMINSWENVQVYVKYTEMAVRCPKCQTFNSLMHESDLVDALSDIGNEDQKQSDTLFVQDEQRAAVQAQQEKVKKSTLLRNYLLKIK